MWIAFYPWVFLSKNYRNRSGIALKRFSLVWRWTFKKIPSEKSIFFLTKNDFEKKVRNVLKNFQKIEQFWQNVGKKSENVGNFPTFSDFFPTFCQKCPIFENYPKKSERFFFKMIFRQEKILFSMGFFWSSSPDRGEPF